MRAGEDRALNRMVDELQLVVVLLPLRVLVAARDERALPERQAGDDALELVIPLRIGPEHRGDVRAVECHHHVPRLRLVRKGELDPGVAARDVARRARDDAERELVVLAAAPVAVVIVRGRDRHDDERQRDRGQPPVNPLHDSSPFPRSCREDYLAGHLIGSSGRRPLCLLWKVDVPRDPLAAGRNGVRFHPRRRRDALGRPHGRRRRGAAAGRRAAGRRRARRHRARRLRGRRACSALGDGGARAPVSRPRRRLVARLLGRDPRRGRPGGARRDRRGPPRRLGARVRRRPRRDRARPLPRARRPGRARPAPRGRRPARLARPWAPRRDRQLPRRADRTRRRARAALGARRPARARLEVGRCRPRHAPHVRLVARTASGRAARRRARARALAAGRRRPVARPARLAALERRRQRLRAFCAPAIPAATCSGSWPPSSRCSKEPGSSSTRPSPPTRSSSPTRSGRSSATPCRCWRSAACPSSSPPRGCARPRASA